MKRNKERELQALYDRARSLAKHARMEGSLTFEQRVAMNVLHLIDLKRAGHSPASTELRVGAGP